MYTEDVQEEAEINVGRCHISSIVGKLIVIHVLSSINLTSTVITRNLSASLEKGVVFICAHCCLIIVTMLLYNWLM